MKRIICWIIGHDWKPIKINSSKFMMLAHLHSMAGWDADCKRCGYQWRDANLTPEAP